MNTKLENRKVVEKLLGPAVEEICVAPTIVKQISDGPIDHAWIKSLEELDKRYETIESKSKGPEQILAVSEVRPLLEDLTNLVRLATFQEVLRLIPYAGHRENTRLSGLTDQGFTFTKHQCTSCSTASIH